MNKASTFFRDPLAIKAQEDFLDAARALIALAQERGVVVEITTVSKAPYAMGHYDMVAGARYTQAQRERLAAAAA
jgi:hypothetical protein